MPFINAHTHLEFGVFAHLLPPPEGAPFVSWIRTVIAARRAIAQDGLQPYQQAVENGIAALRAAGTTTVGDISTTGASIEPLLDSGLSGVVYLEVLGLDPAVALQRLREAQAKIDSYRRRENSMRIGLSIHAPYSCHPDLFRAGAAWCVAENVPLCVHAAESPAEVELLLNDAGDFVEFHRALDLPPLDIPRRSPIAYLEDLGVLAAKPLLVHCVQVDDADIQRIARFGATVAHCPRSNQRLQCGRMPLEKFLATGVPVLLGTDSLSSSPSLDVREEAAFAAQLHSGLVSPDSIHALLQSTSNPPVSNPQISNSPTSSSQLPITTNQLPHCPALLADRFNTLRYDRQREAVILLDRRRYPFAVEFVECRTVEEVARAIEEMVVQGGPPLAYAAGLGLALAAFRGENVRASAERLIATRPTADDLHHLIPQALAIGEESGEAEAVLKFVNGEIERGNEVARRCGQFAAELLADGDRILTHCIAGAALGWMLWIAKEQGKSLHLFPTETRPYLQGARLTAATARELGIPCTLITDGMPAFVMARGAVNKFICAADRITLDGHVTNKIGTYQIAIAARHHRLPFYVLGYDGPDPRTRTAADIPIEERQPDEVFHAAGVDPVTGRAARIRTAITGINGYYPAFDITPPELITAIVTDRGVFAPGEIAKYFDG